MHNSKFKILVINTVEFGRNGISSHIFNYFFPLNKRNYEIHIGNTQDMSNELYEEIREQGVQVHDFSKRNMQPVRYMIELYKHIRKYNYDIVHVHGNSSTMAFDLFPAFCARSRIRIAHSHNTKCSHPLLHKLLRPLLEVSSNARFACSKEAGEWLFLNKKFWIIPNGIDFKKYKFSLSSRQKIRDYWKISRKEKVIGHVGLFNEQKNHEFLIEIFNECSKLNCLCKLMLVGDGPYKEQIKKKVVQFGLEEKVIFCGETQNVTAYLSAMDLFVFPSRFEGLGMALIEAQACGLPCVVSDVVPKVTKISGNISYLSLTEDMS